MEEKSESTIASCDAKQAFWIFRQVFGIGEIDRFINKHNENPNGLCEGIFCKQENSEIAGINAFMGCKIILGQQTIYGAQSCDTAILEKYRKKGFFTQIVLGAEAFLENEGVEILFGIPNDKSFHGFLKMGWKVGSEIGTVFLRLSPFGVRNKSKYLERIADMLFNGIRLAAIRKKAIDNCQIEIKSCFEFGKKDMEQINMREGIHIFKSEDYFKWRIDNNNSQFTYLCVYIEKYLQGYVIFRNNKDTTKRVVEVVDWYIGASESKMREKIFARLVLEISKNTNGYIFIPFTNLESDELIMMKKLGFLLKSSEKRYVMYKILNPEIEEIEGYKWNLKMIDADTIMN